MRAVALLLLSLGSIFSCNNPESARHLNGGDALPSTTLDIDLSRDTTVTMPGGAILKIPQGALDGGGATRVKLEVKEAFLLEDMVRGNLVTRSEGQLLSSGGMIFVNAAAGQTVTFKQPISIMIPTTSVVPGMMVYDGQVDTGGNVNWANPKALTDLSAAGGSAETGKNIFQTNCASCHGMQEELAGPPLGWITGRRDKKWLADFTQNNARMLWRGDAYSCFLFNRYKRSAMPVYHFSDAEMDALYAYIGSASRGIDSNSVPDLKRTFDSCANTDPYCEGAPAKTSTDYTQPKTDVAATSANATTGATGTAGGVGGAGGSYYGFSMDKFGWNSVGILVKDLPGIDVSDLLARVKGAGHDKTEIFLGVPSVKVVERGTYAADKNEYYFDTPDGKITLPQGVEAYIVARSDSDGQTQFGKAKWIIGKHQLVTTAQSSMSAEDIAHAIHELPYDSTSLQQAAAAWDSTGNMGASTAGNGGADSTATASGGSGSSSGSAAGGGAAGGAGGAGGPSGGTDANGSENAAASVASMKKGRRSKRDPASLQACPCWCDEMDYRKADSIARAAGAGQ